MKIGELARRSGVLAVTIRYYEQVALIPAPPRSAGGYRQYAPEHLSRLRFLRRCRDLGFSIAEIRGLLRLAERADQPCEAVTQLAKQHLIGVREKIADLKRLERTLRALVSSCHGRRIANCRILESLNLSSFAEKRGPRGARARVVL